ncbi:MAG: [LysW]-aminoadipate kinase [Chloroflexota bacterium]|nr:[LysW]-aminoadipate kinase [Chloroflexota bacterium]
MINVLKIGGGAGVDHDAVLRNLAERIQEGERWVLVHGCSAEADRLAAAAGIPARTITTATGHTSRYTDMHMIGYFCQAAANVNRSLQTALATHGIQTQAFAAPGVIRAQRHTAIRALVNGRPVVIRDDYSGTISHVDVEAVRATLVEGYLPIIAPVALGSDGEALNVDGDLAASQIAAALGAETLVILSNVPGLLRDVHDPASLVTAFTRSELARYEPLAQGRMKKKLMAAAQAGDAIVILADSRLPAPLDHALAGGGTHITQIWAGHALPLLHTAVTTEATYARD